MRCADFAGLPASRVDEVLALVEMSDAADRRAGGYSTGMRQRLGLAATLLGDPEVLVLDEPANGLDPQGIRWLRDFLRGTPREGRTVLVSSHVLSEVEQTVDDVVVIHRGRLVKSGSIASLIARTGVRVRSPKAAELAAALERDGAEVRVDGDAARGPGAHHRRGRRARLRHRRARARARRGGRLARGGLLPPDQRPGSERAVVSRLVRGELLKLRTTRTALGFTAAVVVLTLAIVLLTILAGDPKTIADKRSALAVGSSISALLLVFGVVGAGAEYRHRTLAPALLVAPGRGRLLAARVIAYGLAGLIIGIVMTVVALAIGVPLLAGQPGPDLAAGDYLRACGGGLVAIVLSTMLGVGVGTLVGSQVPAVIGTMIWIFILEPLSGLIDHIVKYTVGQTATSLGGDTGGDVLPWGAAFLVMLAWTAVFLLAASLVDQRRDVA